MGNLAQFEAEHGPLLGTEHPGIFALSNAVDVELPEGFHEADLRPIPGGVVDPTSDFPLQ